jgi:hypothetical protein
MIDLAPASPARAGERHRGPASSRSGYPVNRGAPAERGATTPTVAWARVSRTPSAVALARLISRRALVDPARTRTRNRRLSPLASDEILQQGRPLRKLAPCVETNIIPRPSRSHTCVASAGSGPRERTVIVNENVSPGRTVF